ncbi:MAG: tRNA-specific adenosine deaminase [Alphaproteobacteria bacterium TMED87]|nr:MAG: tRNA-specific adenosine deaminase [Alphaproteobacteria bacterium TMED87]|tara:strand:- start:191 stop:652 length:462 start_codon:yes stop_codon:yes gene_type:complete
MNLDLYPMKIALEEAKKCFALGEVPIGAVITNKTGKIISKAGNRVETSNDPTAHAEILAIRQASKILNQWRLTECNIYVTLEPCAMCSSAISNSRIKRLFFGCEDKKSGGVNNGAKIFSNKNCHHVPEIYDGFSEKECETMIKNFFLKIRKKI